MRSHKWNGKSPRAAWSTRNLDTWTNSRKSRAQLLSTSQSFHLQPRRPAKEGGGAAEQRIAVIQIDRGRRTFGHRRVEEALEVGDDADQLGKLELDRLPISIEQQHQ